MDEESLKLDAAEAIGKATATVCAQAALVRLLIHRGILKVGDLADVLADASITLEALPGLSPEAMQLARHSLKGYTAAWTKPLTRH